MKMIPRPEPGDKVILKPISGGPGQEPFPETEGIVIEDDPPVYSYRDEDWQVAVFVSSEDVHFYTNVKWDDAAKAWRD